MTPPSTDDDLYAPPLAEIVDREPPTLLSYFIRVCIVSAVCVAAAVLVLMFGVRGLLPNPAITPLSALACCALPTAWLLWARNRMAGEPQRLTPKRFAWLAIGLSACTFGLCEVLVVAGMFCVIMLGVPY